jgi:hypothetical protein
MSDQQMMGFGKFVPGFDFLQNLAKGASQALPQMPNLSSWVAPTLNVEELDKRIGELKAVHFWLDQNSKALAATIQALEVQKMTLATLKGMNFNMGEVANALKLKAADAAAAPAQVVDPMQWWGALTQQFQQIAADAMKDAARNTAVDTAKSMGSAMTETAMRSATDLTRSTAPGSGAKPARKAAKAPRKSAARKKST